MKKVYYLDLTKSDKNGTGITYKIYKQISIMEKNGFEVHELCVNKQFGKFAGIVSKLPFVNLRLNYNVVDEVEDKSIIYIRYFLVDIWLYKKLKRIKSKYNNVKIIIEIPTYPYDDEYKKFHPYIMKDKFYRKKLKQFVDRIVTFSDDEFIYGIKTIRISNGVDIDKISVRTPKETDTVNMIAVAKIAFWHGFDRLITGLSEYYKKNNSPQINIYIVGYGDQKTIDEYKSMIVENGLTEKVFFTGEKHGAELDEIYNKCDMAVDSLGRHRSNVMYNSSLKGKEYMAKGLPVVSGVRTELDNMPDYKYYMRVPANDEPVDFNQVLDFYNRIYGNEPKNEVISNIRSFCTDKFEMTICFKAVIDYMKSI